MKGSKSPSQAGFGKVSGLVPLIGNTMNPLSPPTYLPICFRKWHLGGGTHTVNGQWEKSALYSSNQSVHLWGWRQLLDFLAL